MNTYELTASDGSKMFVITDMEEDALGEEVLDYKTHNEGTFEIEPFIDSVKRKGIYKIDKAQNQNPDRYHDQDQIIRQMHEN